VRIAQIISIVDDDEAVCVATSALVRSLGWQANIFPSAQAFLQSGKIVDTACLISDVRMPNMSGVEMHQDLVRLGHTIPTIFVTAFPTETLRATVINYGALALLEKPVDAAVLEHYLSAALGKP
jgi:FixJ family two-component response regulator